MVQFRKFRNTDPPLLMEVWNESFLGRGAVHLQNVTLLERFVFAKPYFDPEGLIVAEVDERIIGFVHAGLSLNGEQGKGVISLIGVRPDFRRKRVGSDLMRHAETYLRKRGAQVLQAGARGSANPFYLGLYGGSDSPGLLRSDHAAQPFFVRQGYQLKEQVLVLQRDLSKALKLADPRFVGLRTRYEMHVRSPRRLESYAQECDVGQLEPLEFFLQDRQSGASAASTLVWEMEGFSWRWGRPAVGLVNFHVDAALRRQGLAKYLLFSLMRQMQEQYFEIAELQLDESSPAALAFLQNMGFQQVDTGQVFVRAV